jgi:hypothetical protein
MNHSTRKEFGDFQTPLELAREVCRKVRDIHGDFDSVVEPTCGLGAFLHAAAEAFPLSSVSGFEISETYRDQAARSIEASGHSSKVSLTHLDFFDADWQAVLSGQPGRLLLLGNPPWVTNAGVSVLGGANLPVKNNFQGHRGIAARTGKANFDISEWMLIHLLEASLGRDVVVAMLCKTATARKVLRHAWLKRWPMGQAALHRIDAQAHFGASVDACLFMLRTGVHGPREAVLYDSLVSAKAPIRFGLVGDDLVADLGAYERLSHLEGASPYRWRSGIKHDCAAVMELTRLSETQYANGLGETVLLESDVVFPLLKSTALHHGRVTPDRWILLTQRRVGDSTRVLASRAPNAWSYLQQHADRFAARKSSIYRRGEAFALFGIGDYAFSDWKVAVSGLHRPPRFQIIPPRGGFPVMFDDTCYYASVGSREEAEVLAKVLNSKTCHELLATLTLPEAKRPITAEILHRLDLRAIAEEAGLLQDWLAHCEQTSGNDAEPRLAQMDLLMEDSMSFMPKIP